MALGIAVNIDALAGVFISPGKVPGTVRIGTARVIII
jgi:hypothetical protein